MNDDQGDIEAYLESGRYREIKESRGARSRPFRFDPLASLWSGVFGLAALSFICFSSFPVAIHFLQEVNGLGFASSSAITITLIIPPLIVFSFLVITPTFWCGPILVRFLIALLMVGPSCVGFYFSMASWNPYFVNEWDPMLGMFTTMVGFFLASSSLSISLQIWSRWSLSHDGYVWSIPATNTRTMIQLTGVTALLCAALAAIRTPDKGMFLVGGTALAIVITLPAIALVTSFMQEAKRNYFLAAGCLLVFFFVALGVAAAMARDWIGQPLQEQNFPEILGLGIYSTAVITASYASCIWWLRSCGWRCLSRKDMREKRSGQAGDSDSALPIPGTREIAKPAMLTGEVVH